MPKSKSDWKECAVLESNTEDINSLASMPVYNILLIHGSGEVSIDVTTYHFKGRTVLFTTPYQVIYFRMEAPAKVRTLQFHGDFYCIEYHKKEVACNGLLFNNIYEQPYINPEEADFVAINSILDKLGRELYDQNPYSVAVVRAYLQLILAICSKIKSIGISKAELSIVQHPVIEFKILLERHFREERQPAFYAAKIGLSPNAFSKKCKLYFLKTPSALIHERVVLEAKKLIHLSYKSMKEIAAILHFDDENYFSRYFKIHTGVTPTKFRSDVGISVVADLSR